MVHVNAENRRATIKANFAQNRDIGQAGQANVLVRRGKATKPSRFMTSWSKTVELAWLRTQRIAMLAINWLCN